MAKKPLTFGGQTGAFAKKQSAETIGGWKGAGKTSGMEYLKAKDSSSRSSSGNGSGRKTHLAPLILILLIGGFIFGTIIVPGMESGFWQSALAFILQISGLENLTSFLPTEL